jgi:glutathione S-transferase
MMTLYYSPGSCALASHIALEHAGAEYEAVRVDFAQNAQRSPEYLRLNPKGRVPALVTDRGVLSETPAILLYVAQSFPEARLAPLDDAFELARLNAFNSYLCSTVHVAHAHGRRGARWADDAAAVQAMKEKVASNMSDCMALIEREFFRGAWVLGDDYTVSDMYLFTIEQWLASDGVDIARFPRLAEHMRRMASDPAASAALAVERAAA